jgi:hypothetical protein
MATEREKEIKEKAGEKKKEETEIEPTDTFVERIAEGTAISTTPGGFVIIDFLKPVISLMGTKDGKISGYRGEHRPDVRMYLPPTIAKKLRDTLNAHIEGYEKEYGEIKIRG